MNLYLIAALAWILSLGGAYWTGRHHEANAVAARQLDTVKEEIVEHNTRGAADTKAATKLEQKIIYKRDLSREKSYELELDIERKARAAAELAAANPSCPVRSCDLDDRSLGLLRDAVRRANTDPPAAGKSRGDTPGAPEPGRRKGSDDTPVAGESYRGLRRDP